MPVIGLYLNVSVAQGFDCVVILGLFRMLTEHTSCKISDVAHNSRSLGAVSYFPLL